MAINSVIKRELYYVFILQTNQSVFPKKSGTNQFWVSANICGVTFCIFCWSSGRYGQVKVLSGNKTTVQSNLAKGRIAFLTPLDSCHLDSH